MALTFKALSTGEVVATRNRDGGFVFPGFAEFNCTVDAAWHGETYIDSRGCKYDGRAFIALLEKGRWEFEERR